MLGGPFEPIAVVHCGARLALCVCFVYSRQNTPVRTLGSIGCRQSCGTGDGHIRQGSNHMAEQNTDPLETGAEMDYPEHEKTYEMFLGMTKYGTLACAVLLIGMAIGFFTAAGFITSTILTIILFALGVFILK